MGFNLASKGLIQFAPQKKCLLDWKWGFIL